MAGSTLVCFHPFSTDVNRLAEKQARLQPADLEERRQAHSLREGTVRMLSSGSPLAVRAALSLVPVDLEHFTNCLEEF